MAISLCPQIVAGVAVAIGRTHVTTLLYAALLVALTPFQTYLPCEEYHTISVILEPDAYHPPFFYAAEPTEELLTQLLIKQGEGEVEALHAHITRLKNLTWENGWNARQQEHRDVDDSELQQQYAREDRDRAERRAQKYRRHMERIELKARDEVEREAARQASLQELQAIVAETEAKYYPGLLKRRQEAEKMVVAMDVAFADAIKEAEDKAVKNKAENEAENEAENKAEIAAKEAAKEAAARFLAARQFVEAMWANKTATTKNAKRNRTIIQALVTAQTMDIYENFNALAGYDEFEQDCVDLKHALGLNIWYCLHLTIIGDLGISAFVDSTTRLGNYSSVFLRPSPCC